MPLALVLHQRLRALGAQSWRARPHFRICAYMNFFYLDVLFFKSQHRGMPKEMHCPGDHLVKKSCRGLCCSSCRLSVSSREEAESSSTTSDRFPSVSSLAHAMVQERLDQMIRERQQERALQETRRSRGDQGTKFVVMVAMEKSTCDPRQDFRESMEEIITTNRISHAKDLRSLLNCYVSMNSQEYRGIILEVFYEVCSEMFLYRCH